VLLKGGAGAIERGGRVGHDGSASAR
jgi:hypothetical protein